MSCLEAVRERAESIARMLREEGVRVNPFIPRDDAVSIVIKALGRADCEGEVKRAWRSSVYPALKPFLVGQQSPRRGERRKRSSDLPPAGSSSGELVVVTPASALFIALYEVVGERATAIMYDLLEPLIVEKLSGGSGPLPVFYPVVNPDDAVKTLYPLLRGVAEILGRCPDAFARTLSIVLCSRTKFAPMRASGARKCVDRVMSAIRGGCSR